MEARLNRSSASAAEARGDWATVIAMVGGYAECNSVDHDRHNAHLWHMELLVKAGLLRELAELAQADVHARRRLDRFPCEEGRTGSSSRALNAVTSLRCTFSCVCFVREETRPSRTGQSSTPSNQQLRHRTGASAAGR